MSSYHAAVKEPASGEGPWADSNQDHVPWGVWLLSHAPAIVARNTFHKRSSRHRELRKPGHRKDPGSELTNSPLRPCAAQLAHQSSLTLRTPMPLRGQGFKVFVKDFRISGLVGLTVVTAITNQGHEFTILRNFRVVQACVIVAQHFAMTPECAFIGCNG